MAVSEAAERIVILNFPAKPDPPLAEFHPITNELDPGFLSGMTFKYFMPGLSEKLRQFLKGEVADDAATLEAYSRDASLFKVRPEGVVAPKDVSDLTSLIHFVLQEK